jgi:uncharacterized protein YbgA (DUF1722 family)/uncharacterized protein YbbK (DUF523 family)
MPFDAAAHATIRPRIGISSCLIGEAVRFDGGHKRDRFLTETFSQFVDWVPVCPELDAGFGTPRETMRLERHGQAVRLITTRTKRDLTAEITSAIDRRIDLLGQEGLSGYVLKKDSPSCGLMRVKVYEAQGSPARTGRGLFAEALVARFPALPVEEEGRLADPRLRENFIERVFAYQRLRAFFGGPWRLGDLVAFHTAHKLVLMAHSPEAYRRLGRLVADARSIPRPRLVREYGDAFMTALSIVATRGRHANVLRHMAGYFRTGLDAGSRAELAGAIEDYRQCLVPLVVPITLLRHHVRHLDVGYLAGQVYLDPHPRELMLRNHV